MRKKTSYLTLVISVLMSTCHIASASPKCSLTTLKGTYIYGGTGMSDGAVRIEAGQDIFDGKGGIVNTHTDETGLTTVTNGTYMMSPSCIGKSIYKGGISHTIYTSPSGSDISQISSTEGTNMGWRQTRVSTSLKPKCSINTLKGTYIFFQVGNKNGNYYVASGHEAYDGVGGIVNTVIDEKGGKVVTHASYTMNQNCVGESIYSDTGEKYTIYADPTGGGFRYGSATGSSITISAGYVHRVSAHLIQ